MPTNRRRRTRAVISMGPIEAEHLQAGASGHLLGGPCAICNDPSLAPSLWHAHRDEVVESWRRLSVPFPCYAAIAFDGDALPPLDPRWRELFRWSWQCVCDEAAANAAEN